MATLGGLRPDLSAGKGTCEAARSVQQCTVRQFSGQSRTTRGCSCSVYGTPRGGYGCTAPRCGPALPAARCPSAAAAVPGYLQLIVDRSRKRSDAGATAHACAWNTEVSWNTESTDQGLGMTDYPPTGAWHDRCPRTRRMTRPLPSESLVCSTFRALRSRRGGGGGCQSCGQTLPLNACHALDFSTRRGCGFALTPNSSVLWQPAQMLAWSQTGNAWSRNSRAAGVAGNAPGLSAYLNWLPKICGAAAPLMLRPSGSSMMAGMGNSAAPALMSGQRTDCWACRVMHACYSTAVYGVCPRTARCPRRLRPCMAAMHDIPCCLHVYGA